MKPTVSVLLPVYNAERYVESAVRSILTQTFRDFELIIINDGSTDGSKAILEKLAAEDSRIVLISRPNTGYVVALNEAISRSRGLLLARMDSDDISLPTRFEKQVQHLSQNPRCVLVGTDVITMDSDGALIGRMPDIDFSHNAIDRALLRRGWPIVHPAVMMRADAVKKIGAYNTHFCPNEDHDLFLRLAEVGELANLPEVLFQYRKHSASVSATSNQRMTEMVTRIIVTACRRRGIPVPAEVNQLAKPIEAHEQEVSWAWQAMKNKHIQTARKYAFSTLRRRPLSIEAWRLTYCAVRGY